MDAESAAKSREFGDEVAEEEEDWELVNAGPPPPPLLIARGGPLFTSSLVSPVTRIPEFEDAILSELQSLKEELDFDSTEARDHDDITVNDIKILSNEELVEMAFKEVFKEDGGENVSSSQPSVPQTNERAESDRRVSSGAQTRSRSTQRGSGTSASLESTNVDSSDTREGDKKSRKRKKDMLKSRDAEESYPPKVDELLKIKQEQDEEKATAELHSLIAGHKANQSSAAFLESITRMKSLRSVNSDMKLVKTSNSQEVLVQLPEVVLVVEVYHNVHQWQKTQEFFVLGCQCLTELKDKIFCRTDEMMRRSGHHDPSGYFLIEDLFCNDLREPNSIDYSEPIFDWLRNAKEEVDQKWESIIRGDLKRKQKALLYKMPPSKVPGFRRTEMQSLRFCDLRFQLGAPYLYCHQGDCKHTIVIRDLRLINPNDTQNRAAYPIVSFRLKPRLQKCNVCNIFRAKKVTLNDKLASYNPCHFCENCYFLLHYSEDWTLLYDDFTVYDYLLD
ncbi:unnamed protein product [Linum tenue]|uniref:snRNA-activating protein complex subunit n=2 Tax=Linum tenue TaxID=586396 RepID=A0AAV0GXD7_9ROSI|nr:unnamed protein product [Linum tenue]